MARGATLRQLISDLRDELRRTNAPYASPDETPVLRRTINHVYHLLYYKHDWPFLKHRFAPITLNAGQRYYDFPPGLDPEHILTAKVFWSGNYCDICRGISYDDYNVHDPEQNERSSPVMKWDVVFTGTKEQIEVWPLPDGDAQKLLFEGVYRHQPLVNDDDKCALDSELIVLFAAAELLQAHDANDHEAKLQMANELLRLLKLSSSSAGEAQGTFRIGLGAQGPDRPHPRAIVRISR